MVLAHTVKPLLADTPNSGHLLYSGQFAMYQVLFPFIPYLKNLRLSDTIADTSSCTDTITSIENVLRISDTLFSAHPTNYVLRAEVRGK